MEYNQDMLSLSDQPKKLPEMLNVLTILTFVGSAYTIIFQFMHYLNVCNGKEELLNLNIQLDDPIVVNIYEKALTILIVTLFTSLMCLFGAIQMRQLKKQGLIIYTIGKIFNPVVMLIIVGSDSLMGLKIIDQLIMPIIFIVLYTTQRKHLVN